MSIFEKARLGLGKTLFFWLVTEMLSFPFFREKCCEHIFFNLFGKNDLGVYYYIHLEYKWI